MRDLNPPEDVEEEFESLLDDADAALDEAADVSGADLLDENSPDPFEDVNEQATELGLTACAQ